MLARGRGAGESKNSRSDDRADAQRRQRPRSQRLLQPVFWPLGVRYQLVNGLLGEKLAGQKGLLEITRPE